MVVHKTLSVFTLVLMVSHLMAKDFLTKIDQEMLKLMPFGDSKVKYPEKANQYIDLCDSTSKWVSSTMFKANLMRFSVKSTREFLPLLKDRANNNLCKIAKKNETEYLIIAKGFNGLSSRVEPIRTQMTNAMVAAATIPTNYASPDVGCFFEKWLDETEKQFSTDFIKYMFKDSIREFKIVLVKLKPVFNCDWSNIPSTSFPKFRSIEVLYFNAVKNIEYEQPRALEKKIKKLAKEAYEQKAKELKKDPVATLSL